MISGSSSGPIVKKISTQYQGTQLIILNTGNISNIDLRVMDNKTGTCVV